MAKVILVSLYLLVAIGSNLLINALGPSYLWLTAFILIPFDLTTRDLLHEAWNGRNLKFKMFLLITSGSILTYAVNSSALMIAVASSMAFLISGIIDTAVYEALKTKDRLVKMTASNVGSSITDSLIFPIVAFGVIDVSLFASQSISKSTGGFLWSLLLVKLINLRSK